MSSSLAKGATSYSCR